MAKQTVDSEVQHTEQLPEDAQVASQEPAPRSLLNRFVSRVPHTKAFHNWMTERREGRFKERLDKYQKLESISPDTKKKLSFEFEYGARQLAQVDSWLEMVRFYSKSLVIVTIVLIWVAVPPMVARFFPHLTGRGFQGLLGWALELVVSLLTCALALLIIFLPIYFMVGSEERVNDFFNANGLIVCWSAVLLPLACTYLYALYAGRLVTWPWYLSHKLVFYSAIQTGFGMPLFISFVMPSRILRKALNDRRLRVQTRAVIVDELLEILSTIEDPKYGVTWAELSHRGSLTMRLTSVASCLENHFPRYFLTGVAEMDRWTGHNATEMANGVREMIKRIVASNAYTLEDLKARVVKDFAAALASDWGTFDRVPAEKLSRKQGVKDRATSAIRVLLTAAVPVLLLLLLKRLRVVMAEPLLTYLTVGAYVWAALSLLSRLDPQYAAKLGALKDINSILPFGKKGGDDK